MQYYVYIMSNDHKNVIYIGVTNDLIRRVYEHKNHLDKGSFTSRYNVENLVYYEVTTDIDSAIEREKQIKGWNRKRKDKLNAPKIKKAIDELLAKEELPIPAAVEIETPKLGGFV